MIVVDSSVLVAGLSGTDSREASARRALSADATWTAPAHWMAEAFSALRGLARGGKLPNHRAEIAIRRLTQLEIRTVPLDSLLPSMWQLRHNLTGYDAAYVALAHLHDLTLVTADRGMARAAVEHCRVELVMG